MEPRRDVVRVGFALTMCGHVVWCKKCYGRNWVRLNYGNGTVVDGEERGTMVERCDDKGQTVSLNPDCVRGCGCCGQGGGPKSSKSVIFSR